jgi:hypothetical protein
MDRVKIALYLVVIVAAAGLHEPWMIALQAGLGGFALGARVSKMWFSPA